MVVVLVAVVVVMVVVLMIVIVVMFVMVLVAVLAVFVLKLMFESMFVLMLVHVDMFIVHNATTFVAAKVHTPCCNLVANRILAYHAGRQVSDSQHNTYNPRLHLRRGPVSGPSKARELPRARKRAKT